MASKSSVSKSRSARDQTRALDIQIQFMEGVVRRDPRYVEALQLLGSLLHESVRTNISFGDTTISDAEILVAIEKAGAGDFLRSLPEGLDTNVGEMGGKLSGGQRQRISLARALVGNPAILILDEVTSALDPKTEAEIIKNIVELGSEYTIIAITHRPAWTRVADHLYTVAGGQVRRSTAKKQKR